MRNLFLNALKVWVLSMAMIGVASAADDTVVNKVNNEKQLSTFSSALKAAGFSDALNQKGPFTLFAPSDAAFAKLPAGTLENLMKPENKDKLSNLLKHTIVPGIYTVNGIKDGKSELRSAGGNLAVEKNKSDITVNGAKVTEADIKASNGVVYIIDTVIMPTEAAK